MGPRIILIDGYNTIRNVPALAIVEMTVSIAAGRDALAEWVVSRYRHTPHRVFIVFDGDGVAESVQPIRSYSRGTVIFTAQGVTADARIVELAAEHAQSGEVCVVTDDREVRDGAARDGARVVGNAQFAADVNQPPRDLRKRFQHQQAIRGIQESRDAGTGPNRSRGNPRKAPKRHRGKSSDPWA